MANEIVKVSLESHVLSRFTAYVAVDRSEVVNRGGRQQQIIQPVEPPDGWEMSAEAHVLRECAAGMPTLSTGLVFDACWKAAAPQESPKASFSGGWRSRGYRAATRVKAADSDLAAAVAEIGKLLDKLDLGKHKRQGWCRKRLEQLRKLLTRLADILRGDQRYAVDVLAIEQISRDAEQLIVPEKGGQPVDLPDGRLESWMTGLRAVLARLNDASGPPPARSLLGVIFQDPRVCHCSIHERFHLAWPYPNKP